ncbi:something about silencing, SAS, complex subunit 4-domain-containing protein [Amylocarpus encephaloides]|uniref:Something about silencing, SAS, complex subunit 4-domain-containing protein n=1 Tax=Amylocarpus encephaloides TaxID=45428 RepID=A0A9P8C145_9HELO|nr:something about silencing, SAS, complex subunit 4-domain-containing protein [Amylocarpus encephaloides]
MASTTMLPMASRSSRRPEGLTLRTRSSARSNVAVVPQSNASHHHQSNIGRKKRLRDSIKDAELGFPQVKKTKITLEIKTRPQLKPNTRSLVIEKEDGDTRPERGPYPAPPTLNETATQTGEEGQTPRTVRKSAAHQQKVANGIRHELDRLQPKAADLKDEKRKLRSQEGARFKSELSLYFLEYDEVIGNAPKEDDILELDTPIMIVDSAETVSTPHLSPRKSDEKPTREFPSSLFDDLHDARRVDYSHLEANYQDEGRKDPLSPEYFHAMHRRPERQEKAIRNTDKGRAQHEKDQITRLLAGLQGHDWLKMMGVSGVTDTKKKEFEPARDHFILGCETILEKFRNWKDEEKRRRLEKELAQADAKAESEEMGLDDDAESNANPPDNSDVDASAAKQLHDEAIARSTTSRSSSNKKRKSEPPPVAIEPEKEFTSFFAKPYLRAAALGKHRRSNRSVSAWGHSVPEVPELDFELPEEFRDEESMKTQARRKRLNRRVSKI